MSKYQGKSVTVNQSATDLYNKVSNFDALQQRIDQVPAEAREKLGQVKFAGNQILIEAPMVGQLAFEVVKSIEPSHIKLNAAGAPVEFNIHLDFAPIDENHATFTPTLEADIPVMLRPMIGGKLQEAADKFSEMFTNFFA